MDLLADDVVRLLCGYGDDDSQDSKLMNDEVRISKKVGSADFLYTEYIELSGELSAGGF